MTKGRGLGLVIVAVLAMFALTACGSHKGSATLIGVRYTDSLASGGKAHGCINPGQRVTTTDAVYWLPGPGNERQDLWDSSNKAADHTDLTVTTKDGQSFTVALNVNFGMVADCDTLHKFMQTIGLTRGAYFEDDDTYKAGWITAMDYYISSNVIARTKTAFNAYTAKEMYPQTDKWAGDDSPLSQAIAGGDALQNAVDKATNGNKFYTIGNIQVIDVSPNTDYAQAIQDRQNAETAAQTAQINRDNQVAQAKADAQVAKAKAAVTQAQVSAFGKGPAAMNAYLKSLVIAGGGNPFQPTYVVGGTGQQPQPQDGN